MTSTPHARLHIPKPCHEDWDAMTAASRGRHCASCDKTVVDVTRMAPPEAARFLDHVRTSLPHGAHVCVRAHADRSGRLLTPSATRRLLTNGLAAVISMTIAGCHGDGPEVAPSGSRAPTTSTQQAAAPGSVTGEPLMGDACVEPPPGNIVKGEPEVQQVVTGLVAAPPPPAVMGEVEATPDVRPAPVVATPEPEPQVLMGKPSMDPTPEVQPKP